MREISWRPEEIRGRCPGLDPVGTVPVQFSIIIIIGLNVCRLRYVDSYLPVVINPVYSFIT